MVNTRLAIGIHILSFVQCSNNFDALNSEIVADSIQTNPVVVRRMTSALKKAGLLKSVKGNRGLILTKEPKDISFLEILKAVDPSNELFIVHQNPNPACLLGQNLVCVLACMFDEIQKNTEQELSKQNIQQVLDRIDKELI